MKIDTKPLSIGKDSVEVEASWARVDEADEIMIALYSVDANADNIVKSLQAEQEAMKKSMEFLKSLLGLSAKQTEKIYQHLSAKTLNLYISYVCGLIKGAPAQSFTKFENEVNEQPAPKGKSAKSDE
ncbi:phage tail tube assembly chaperone [uncultured Limosilactobacillus sp.]|uniref:phage tail tube assembly chaperone n=1 Tax=uncultured Limosilactobacillus sp. TaxID=2837629 RepID=UPI002586C4B1|nr:phage tail tube assembly chaperone [uncultured Limosilactobacillus sp.]